VMGARTFLHSCPPLRAMVDSLADRMSALHHLVPRKGKLLTKPGERLIRT
jgi:hypothetical protein